MCTDLPSERLAAAIVSSPWRANRIYPWTAGELTELPVVVDWRGVLKPAQSWRVKPPAPAPREAGVAPRGDDAPATGIGADWAVALALALPVAVGGPAAKGLTRLSVGSRLPEPQAMECKPVPPCAGIRPGGTASFLSLPSICCQLEGSMQCSEQVDLHASKPPPPE